ncbi:MAG TPA: membrane protein insertion efficiency factor YidD [Anaeromyxobacteraceae bacterium]|nr:membrane protein insertion efficiency factor YidD [Anaeromyxobacteraceae bacterium]
MIRWLLLALIQLYRWLVSPLLPAACRFHPTCSTYAAAAVRQHGAARGGWLALRRLARCHPFCEGGIDPVPEPQKKVKLGT